MGTTIHVLKLSFGHFSLNYTYQLVLQAIPSNSLATDIRFFDMWTRFRDVRRLWEQLADLHKKARISRISLMFYKLLEPPLKY